MMRIYEYGLRPPTFNEGLVRSQMKDAHEYRRWLTWLEKGRRTLLRKVIDQQPRIRWLRLVLRAFDEQCLLAAQAVRSARIATRSQDVDPEIVARLVEARSRRRAAYSALTAARKSRLSDAHVRAVNERTKEIYDLARKNGWAHCPAQHGALQLVADAHNQSCQELKDLWLTPPKRPGEKPRDGIGLTPQSPWAPPWEGEGFVSCQFSERGGMPVSIAMGAKDTRFRIDRATASEIVSRPLEPLPYVTPAQHRGLNLGKRRRGLPVQPPPQPKKERAEKYTVVSLRVGSDEKRRPIWASWPCILDRPLPEGGRIARATVFCRREGPREFWRLRIEVNEAPREVTCGIGAVAIDVGWRSLRDGSIRCAAWGDDQNNCGEIRIDPKTRAALEHADGIESVRDKNFDAARASLSEFLSVAEIPAWLQRRTRSLSAWKAQAKLAALVLHWRQNRFAKDESIFELLETWRQQDKHLWDYAAGQRSGSIARRNDLFRCWADWLARTYDTVVIENFDKRAVATSPDLAETEDEQSERARANRQQTAASVLCGAIKNAVLRRGGTFVMHDPEHTTHDCAIVSHARVCASREAWDQAKELMHTCSECKTTWDQDVNAWRNLLSWHRNNPNGVRFRVDASGSVESVVLSTARANEKSNKHVLDGEKRWDRVRRLRAEQKTRTDIARGASSNTAE